VRAAPPQAEKPIDLFKAIFEDDSDSDDDEDDQESQGGPLPKPTEGQGSGAAHQAKPPPSLVPTSGGSAQAAAESAEELQPPRVVFQVRFKEDAF